MRSQKFDFIDWPQPYPNIAPLAKSRRLGFAGVWGQVVNDLEALEAAEIAARTNTYARLTVDEQQAIFRISPHATWVYCMYAPASNLVKIGRTDHPNKRISTLKTGSPVKLECIALVRAHEHHESMIHTALAEFREHGEWFRYEGPVCDLIKQAREDGVRPFHEYICKRGVDGMESIL